MTYSQTTINLQNYGFFSVKKNHFSSLIFNQNPMTEQKTDRSDDQKPQKPDSGYFTLALIFLPVLCATFLVANSGLELKLKLIIFVGLIAVFALLFWGVCQKQMHRAKSPYMDADEAEPQPEAAVRKVFDAEIERKLFALEDAREFFSASLKSSDMIRLVANRINEMIPFAACALFLVDEGRTGLNVVYAVGENADALTGLEIPLSKGLAGKVVTDQKPDIDRQLRADKVIISSKSLEGFETAMAVPLYQDSDVFGVLELFGKNEQDFGERSLQLLAAVGERFAPLFLSSRAFEQSLANALTDSLTNLPNERAFFLVLENQIAEAQRFRDERPLTVLAIDIKNFAKLNKRFGHTTGDEILSFSAGLIKNGLRRMDFLARSMGDEFLTVLPTASGEIAREITERLEQTFAENPFEASPEEKITIRLNFGAATFWKDGETPNQLLQTAYLRKHHSKSSDSPKLAWFPRN